MLCMRFLGERGGAGVDIVVCDDDGVHVYRRPRVVQRVQHRILVGWIGFDPTLGKPIELRHIRVANGRDYGDVPPVRGVYKGRVGQSLSVDVRFRPEMDETGQEYIGETSSGLDEDEGSGAERPQQQSQQ
jgi:transglutaminase-like putative cysteine protease